MIIFLFCSLSKALTSTEAYMYEAKLMSACTLIRQPDEVSKIVLEKEAKGVQLITGIEMNLNDHNIMEEILFCVEDGGYSGPYQFSAAAIGN